MSDKVNTGGPAFPRLGPPNDCDLGGMQDGMTVLELVSLQAMNGILANRAMTIHSKPLAEYCFEVADAWLAERNKRMES